MFEGVVCPDDPNFAVAERPARVEVGDDPTAVQIDRLVAGSCRKFFDAPVTSPATGCLQMDADSTGTRLHGL